MSDTKSDPKLDVSNPPAQKLDKSATSNISKAELREHIDRLIFRWFGEPVQVVEDDIVTLIADQQRQLLSDLIKQGVFVTYKADNGHGIAVPVELISDVRNDIREGLS